MHDDKKPSFIEKHKPLTKKDLEEKFRSQEEAKKEISQNAAELEANLSEFNRIIDPLVNPSNKKPLCWIRRPTQSEWEKLLPPEMLVYRDKPEEAPPEVLIKANDMIFELMATLIVKPEHDSNWWKEHANLVLIKLFQMHLSGVYQELGILAENF